MRRVASWQSVSWFGAIAAGLMLALAGCGDGANDATSPSGGGSAKSPRIALVMKSLANEFFKTMAEGAEANQKGFGGYELIVNGIKDERDLAGQVRLVEDMAAQGVDAIVIAPADSKALVAACKRAKDAGIVVVNIDNKLDAEVLKEQGVAIPFVGPDNRKGTELLSEHLAKSKLKEGDPVAIIEGIPTAFNGQQRRLGYENAAKAHGWKIVETQSGQWEINEANRVASAILREHPEVKALLCCNDSMALGAVAAVKDAGKTGQVIVTGYDGISAVRSAIREGTVEATVEQHGNLLAVYGIEYALQILKDPKTVPPDKDTPIEVITEASFHEAPSTPRAQ
jgi:ribose transport system substrate-binding protein